MIQKTGYFIKIIKGLVPDYPSSLLPKMREQTLTFRKANSIVAPKRRMNAFRNSFPRMCQQVEQSKFCVSGSKVPSLFTTRLISLVRPVKWQLSGIHDPSRVRRLTQLRLGLGRLGEHRFRNNFLRIDPMCLSNNTLST